MLTKEIEITIETKAENKLKSVVFYMYHRQHVLVNFQYVQHDITNPVWIYSDSRDLFKVNTEHYYWWQQSCYNWYAGELEEKYDWMDDGSSWS